MPQSDQTGGAAADKRRAPFFCVPGIGGNVMNLQALASRLAPAHRLVALRTGLASSQPRSVEHLAADVAAAVLKHRYEGRLMLGGYSGGAAIAFEVARQLSAAGHEVGMLVLIDTRRPGWRPTARTLPATARHFVANLPGWVRDDLLQSSRRQAWRNVRRHLRQAVRGRHTLEGIIDVSRYPAEARLAMQREFEPDAPVGEVRKRNNGAPADPQHVLEHVAGPPHRLQGLGQDHGVERVVGIGGEIGIGVALDHRQTFGHAIVDAALR